MADHASHTTVDHDEIRRWAEERGARPTSVKNTGKSGEAGILRLDFEQNGRDEDLCEISWDEFFEKFDQKKLAFLYQDEKKSGEGSTFFKFIERDGAQLDEPKKGKESPTEGNAELARLLNDVIRAELRAYQLYQEVRDKSPDEKLKKRIEEVIATHDEYLIEIENAVFAFGGEPTALQEFGRTSSRQH